MSRYFARGREPLSSYTHFWGIVFGVLGTALLAVRCRALGVSVGLRVGCLVFGLSLVALYTASCVYHYALCAPRPLLRLRKLDHAMIYVLIAGTYTPLCVKYLAPEKLPVFLGALWGAAALGILFKLCWLDAPRWIGTALYLALGWAILADLPAFSALESGCFALVLAGGVLYSVGAVVYAIKKPNLLAPWGFHELFHLFILAGSVCHFAAVYFFVI